MNRIQNLCNICIALLAILCYSNALLHAQTYTVSVSPDATNTTSTLSGKTYINATPYSGGGNVGLVATMACLEPTTTPSNGIRIYSSTPGSNQTPPSSTYKCNGHFRLYRRDGSTASIVQTMIYSCGVQDWDYFIPASQLHATGTKEYFGILFPNGMSCQPPTQLCVGSDGVTSASWVQGLNGNGHYMGTWNITATLPPSPPQNDNPCQAMTVPVGNSCTWSTYHNFNATTTGLQPGCANYQGEDVWFRTTVPSNGAYIMEAHSTSAGISNGGAAVYNGSCSALSVNTCDDNSGYGLMPRLEMVNLAPGSTSFIQFWDKGGDQQGTFDLCIKAMATSVATPQNPWIPGASTTVYCTKNFTKDAAVLDLYKAGVYVQRLQSSITTGSVSFTVPAGLTGGNDYHLRIEHENSANVYGISGLFSVAGSGGQCIFTNPLPTQPAHQAFCDLADDGIIQYRIDGYPDEKIPREDAVYVLVTAFENGSTSPARKYPMWSRDLQSHNVETFNVLRSLTYNDEEAVIKTQINYQPGDDTQIRYWIKMLWETFNLPRYTIPTQTVPAPVFTLSTGGVIAQHSFIYSYLLPAYEAGILLTTQNVDQGITRRKAFYQLWKVLNNLDQAGGWSLATPTGAVVRTRPTSTDVTNPLHYNKPINTDLYNIVQPKDLSDGIFGQYFKSGMYITGDGSMGIGINASYSGLWSHLPEAFRANNGLGDNPNWTLDVHDYFLYVQGSQKSFSPWYENQTSYREKDYFVHMDPTGVGEVWEADLSGNPMTQVHHGPKIKTVTMMSNTPTLKQVLVQYKGGGSAVYRSYYKNEYGYDVYMLGMLTNNYNQSVRFWYEPGAMIILPDGTPEQAYRLKYIEPAGGGAHRRFELSYDPTSSNDKLIDVVDNSDGSGNERHFQFTYAGENIATITDPENNQWRYTYHTGTNHAHLHHITWPEQNVTTLQMTDHYVSTISTPSNGTIVVAPSMDYGNNTYTKNVQVFDGTNALVSSASSSATYTNDYGSIHHGYPTQSTNTANGISHTTTMQYNNIALPSVPTTITHSNGIIQTLRFQGDVLVQRDIAAPASGTVYTEKWEYDANNEYVMKYTDANDVEWRVSRTSEGRVENIFDGLGRVIQRFSYDPKGQLFSIRTAGSDPIIFGNYIHGVPRSITQGNRIVNQVVSGRGLVQEEIVNGRTYKTAYDKNDFVRRTETPMGKTYDYALTGNSELRSITTHWGDVTVFDYYPTTRLLHRINRFGKSIEYTYDPNHFYRLSSVKLQDNTLLTQQYITGGVHDGFLSDDGYATMTYYNNPSTAYHNMLHTITNKDNNTVDTYEYDEFGREKKHQTTFSNGSLQKELQFAYDGVGNTISISYNGKIGEYRYNENRQVDTIVFDGMIIGRNIYNQNGQLQETHYGNGVVEQYTYTTHGELQQRLIYNQSTQLIGGEKIFYNFNGMVDSVLLAEGYKEARWPERQFSYTADPTTQQVQSLQGTLNGGFPVTVSATYDDRGNMITTGGDFVSTMTYDTRNNLLSQVRNGSILMYSAQYNGMGLVVEDNAGYRYLLDTRGQGDVLIQYAPNGNPRWYYIYANGGLFARVSPNGNTEYYHFNYRGDTKMITDASGVVIKTYDYTTYGEPYNIQESGDTNPYRHSGKFGVRYINQFLSYHRARYYNPIFRRFNSMDPVYHSNPYQYCEGNPVNFVDPNGMSAIAVDAQIGAGSIYVGDPVEVVGLPPTIREGKRSLYSRICEGRHRNHCIDPFIEIANLVEKPLWLTPIGAGRAASTKAVVAFQRVKIHHQAYTSSKKVQKAKNAVVDFLGDNARVIINGSKDHVFLSKDGLRVFRLDLFNPGNDLPHWHLQIRRNLNSKWRDVIKGFHRIYIPKK